jgi:hypothetical protein
MPYVASPLIWDVNVDVDIGLDKPSRYTASPATCLLDIDVPLTASYHRMSKNDEGLVVEDSWEDRRQPVRARYYSGLFCRSAARAPDVITVAC